MTLHYHCPIVSSTNHIYQDLEASLPDEETVLSDEECLKERKWWVFLLSSVLTFIVGVMSVVVARAFVALCCRKDEDDYTQASRSYLLVTRSRIYILHYAQYIFFSFSTIHRLV